MFFVTQQCISKSGNTHATATLMMMSAVLVVVVVVCLCVGGGGAHDTIRVHMIPHSHVDHGWLSTIHDYQPKV